MPLSHAAEKIVSPSSAVIIRPSTSSVRTLMRRLRRGRHPAMPGRTAMLPHMCIVLPAEMPQRAQHRVGRRDAQAAQAGRAQQPGQFFQHREIGLLSVAARHARQDLVHLHRAGAARNALAARFVPAEFHEETREIHHAGGRVHHNQAARAHHRADAPERIVVHREIEMRGGNAAARGTAGLRGFEFVPGRNAAAETRKGSSAGAFRWAPRRARRARSCRPAQRLSCPGWQANRWRRTNLRRFRRWSGCWRKSRRC